MRVKICGITNPDDALAAAQFGADFIGLILAPSARRVTVESARRVRDVLPPAAQPVLLFRNAPLDEVHEVLAATGCEWVQLHGGESPSYLKELATRHPQIHLIKAWEVSSPQAGDELANYLRQVKEEGVRIDVIILDAPKGGPHPGYDCLGDVSRRCVERPPACWCAGGLTPANVAAAVADGCYDGVDVAGGVELRPGRKDHAALRRFIETAQQQM
ncbi:MAG: phosphoribosylanthranilate isomerase [Phycisphaerae bacterium]|nr:phosphoribosylanthranilate isomerase [Phycisphaerae bacterium]